MIKKESNFYDLKTQISKELKIVKELNNLMNTATSTDDKEEKKLIDAQINSLKTALKKVNLDLKRSLDKASLVAPLKESSDFKKPVFKPLARQTLTPAIVSKAPEIVIKKEVELKKKDGNKIKIKVESVEKDTLDRLKDISEEKKEKKIPKKGKGKASGYVRLSNQFFSGTSEKLINKGYFKNLKRNLVKANMQFLTKSYVSVIFFTTLLSLIISIGLFGFFLFFNFGVNYPFITFARQDLFTRALNIFWIMLIIPLGTWFMVYIYPVLEKKSIETKIEQELPFATIHMSSISESMIEPSNIFKIMVKTGEYPTLQKEFIKVINEINVFGRDLVTALRNSAFNSPSKKLSELLDGLATTITSGGDLSDFFDKRSQTLLFEYKLEKEKRTKSAETFMDIYISVVIAAPMILMLLLIMMRVSGLGIALSTSMISLIMVLGVSFVNIIFLGFLQMRSQV